MSLPHASRESARHRAGDHADACADPHEDARADAPAGARADARAGAPAGAPAGGAPADARVEACADARAGDCALDRAGHVALEQSAHAKERALVEWLRARGSVLIGFSGGVDSSYLAAVAVESLGAEHTLAVIGRSASYPEAQWAMARQVADRFAIPVLEVSTDEMNDPRYAENPVNRCYFCKSELWDTLVPIATERKIAFVVDGTNADDLTDYRPGAAAAREHAVLSPLAAVGLTKADIRLLSRARGIASWSQPSSPCLSSRVPYGTAVTPARLRQIELAEGALRALGVGGDLRVRYHDELARVELCADELQRWLAPHRSRQLATAIRSAGFQRVAIDLRGFRSGSLNVLGGVVEA